MKIDFSVEMFFGSFASAANSIFLQKCICDRPNFILFKAEIDSIGTAANSLLKSYEKVAYI